MALRQGSHMQVSEAWLLCETQSYSADFVGIRMQHRQNVHVNADSSRLQLWTQVA